MWMGLNVPPNRPIFLFVIFPLIWWSSCGPAFTTIFLALPRGSFRLPLRFIAMGWHRIQDLADPLHQSLQSLPRDGRDGIERVTFFLELFCQRRRLLPCRGKVNLVENEDLGFFA